MSFEYNKLRGRIKEIFGTQEKFALAMGISKTSMSNKLNGKTYFTQTEISNACILLKIHSSEEVNKYFFTQKVQKTELNDQRRGK